MLFHAVIEELENSAELVINRQTSIISRREHQNLENIYKKEMEDYIETKLKSVEHLHS